jgi:hypothetical protein
MDSAAERVLKETRSELFAVGWVIRNQEVCCGKIVLYMVL